MKCLLHFTWDAASRADGSRILLDALLFFFAFLSLPLPAELWLLAALLAHSHIPCYRPHDPAKKPGWGVRTSPIAAGISRDDASLAILAGEALPYVQPQGKGQRDRLSAVS